jgi:hypothetical protein
MRSMSRLKLMVNESKTPVCRPPEAKSEQIIDSLVGLVLNLFMISLFFLFCRWRLVFVLIEALADEHKTGPGKE